jgi:tetratricopeptide (TPR) repeat protein
MINKKLKRASVLAEALIVIVLVMSASALVFYSVKQIGATGAAVVDVTGFAAGPQVDLELPPPGPLVVLDAEAILQNSILKADDSALTPEVLEALKTKYEVIQQDDLNILAKKYLDRNFAHYDPIEARKIYAANAERGNREARLKLAELYKEGIGGHPNPNSAVKIYAETLNREYSDVAQNGLIELAKNGNKMALEELEKRKEDSWAKPVIDEITRIRERDPTPGLPPLPEAVQIDYNGQPTTFRLGPPVGQTEFPYEYTSEDGKIIFYLDSALDVKKKVENGKSSSVGLDESATSLMNTIEAKLKERAKELKREADEFLSPPPLPPNPAPSIESLADEIVSDIREDADTRLRERTAHLSPEQRLDLADKIGEVGFAEVMLARFDKAAEMFQAAAEIESPPEVRAWYYGHAGSSLENIAVKEKNPGIYWEAANNYKLAGDTYPQSGDAYVKANYLNQAGEAYEEAESHYEAALAYDQASEVHGIDNNEREIYVEKANIAFEYVEDLGEFVGRNAPIETTLQATQKVAGDLSELAEDVSKSVQDAADAIAALDEKIRQQAESNAKALADKGTLAFDDKDWEEAAKNFQLAALELHLPPESQASYTAMAGDAYHAMYAESNNPQHLSSAGLMYGLAAERYPSEDTVKLTYLSNQAGALLMAGDYGGSAVAYREASNLAANLDISSYYSQYYSEQADFAAQYVDIIDVYGLDIPLHLEPINKDPPSTTSQGTDLLGLYSDDYIKTDVPGDVDYMIPGEKRDHYIKVEGEKFLIWDQSEERYIDYEVSNLNDAFRLVEVVNLAEKGDLDASLKLIEESAEKYPTHQKYVDIVKEAISSSTLRTREGKIARYLGITIDGRKFYILDENTGYEATPVYDPDAGFAIGFSYEADGQEYYVSSYKEYFKVVDGKHVPLSAEETAVIPKPTPPPAPATVSAPLESEADYGYSTTTASPSATTGLQPTTAAPTITTSQGEYQISYEEEKIGGKDYSVVYTSGSTKIYTDEYGNPVGYDEGSGVVAYTGNLGPQATALRKELIKQRGGDPDDWIYIPGDTVCNNNDDCIIVGEYVDFTYKKGQSISGTIATAPVDSGRVAPTPASPPATGPPMSIITPPPAPTPQSPEAKLAESLGITVDGESFYFLGELDGYEATPVRDTNNKLMGFSYTTGTSEYLLSQNQVLKKQGDKWVPLTAEEAAAAPQPPAATTGIEAIDKQLSKLVKVKGTIAKKEPAKADKTEMLFCEKVSGACTVVEVEPGQAISNEYKTKDDKDKSVDFDVHKLTKQQMEAAKKASGTITIKEGTLTITNTETKKVGSKEHKVKETTTVIEAGGKRIETTTRFTDIEEEEEEEEILSVTSMTYNPDGTREEYSVKYDGEGRADEHIIEGRRIVYGSDGKPTDGYIWNAKTKSWVNNKETVIAQYNSRQLFWQFEKVLTDFSGLGYYATLFFDDESLDEWRETVDQTFATLYLGTEYWESEICSVYVDRDQEGVAYIDTRLGLSGVAAHIEATRSLPIEIPGAGSAHLRDSEGKTASAPSSREFIYKITFNVKNGDYDDDPKALEVMRFNVVLKGERTVPLFREKIEIEKGDRSSFTGKNAIVQFSSFKYDTICMEFDDVPYSWSLDDDELCNKIIAPPGTAQPRFESKPAQTGTQQTQQGNGQGNVNDI